MHIAWPPQADAAWWNAFAPLAGAGHKAFVDYSGKKVPIIDALTGEVRMAEIFVAVLGASNLTYAGRSRPQRWIDATNLLLGLQAEYVDWLMALPDSLRGTAMAEIKPPRGYGRD